MPIRAFLFDMDGLLIDTEDVHMRAFAATATKHGVSMRPEEFRRWIGIASPVTCDWLAERAVTKRTSQEILMDEQVEFQRILESERPRPLPGVREMLEHTETQGLRRGLVSSTIYPQVVMTMRVVLGHLGRSETLEHTFHATVTGDRVDNHKPHPEPYEKAAKALGLATSECLVFEDSPAGAQAGRAAGCKVVAIPNLYLQPEMVAPHAHKSFRTLAEAFAARVWESF